MLRASASASGIGNWALRPSVSPASAGRAGSVAAAACREGLESLAEIGAAVRRVAVSCVGVACGEAVFSAPGAAVAAFAAAAMISGSAGMAFSAGVLRGFGGVRPGHSADLLAATRSRRCACSLPLGARLGRAFLRRVALIGRREALAVYACKRWPSKASPFAAGLRPGSVGTEDDRPRTMLPQAPMSKQRRP